MTRTLAVWWEGAVVGTLTADRHGAMRFAYDADWLADPSTPALSISLPKRPEPFPPRQCRPFFEGLLPEGAQRDAVASALGVSRANEFRLLERLGGEVAGALSLQRGAWRTPRSRVARRTTLEELRRGDWDRFAQSAGLGAPFVRRRVRELADLAPARAATVVGELAHPGLNEDALAACAERVTERARRLALTV